MLKEYKPEYLPLFEQDVSEVKRYISSILKNPAAAERLVDEIEKAVEKRLLNPTAYRKYHSAKDRKQPYYTIRVNNYLIFYVVIDDVMEMRRFVYSRRDISRLV